MTLPNSAKEQHRFTPSDYGSETRDTEETTANKLRGKKRELRLAEIAARFENPPIYLLATPTILERAKWRRSVLATGARWHDDGAMVACLKRGIAEVVAPAQEAELLDIVDRFAGCDEGQAPKDLAIDFEETLPIHYTLGRDVAEVLGDDVESAVFRIFREVANEISMGMGQTEIEMLRSGFLASVYWDKENQIACLHVELVHTDSQISGEDFDAYDREYPPGRPLN